MRRSRISPAPFAVLLLVSLIVALWLSAWSAPKAPEIDVAPPAVQGTQPAPDATVAGQDPAIPQEQPAPAHVPLTWVESVVETPGFPDERVRQVRPESIPPDELYPQNRVIIRKTIVAAGSYGMQVSGEVLTDFYCDRGPSWWPNGALLGLKIMVDLYYWDTVFERDIGSIRRPGSNHVKLPQIDPQRDGKLIDGQSATVATHELRGEFAVARFALPVLKKPLAPGVYRVVARLHFGMQDGALIKSIKWCSDLYGSKIEQDSDTLEVTYKDVMQNRVLHDEVYDDLIYRIGSLKDEAVIWMGEACRDGVVKLVPPGTAHTPANCLIWDYHLTVVEQVAQLSNQLDNVDAEVQDQLEAKLKTFLRRDATDEEKREHEKRKVRWKAEAEDERKRIKRDNKAQIDRLGGRASRQEELHLTASLSARLDIAEQVGRFHEYLTLRYWVLTEGYLTYSGWNTVYNPGYNACDAVTRNNNTSASRKRKDDDTAVRDVPAGYSVKWGKRRDLWKYVPDELTEFAFEYLRTKEETDDHDAERFTLVAAGKTELNCKAWRDYRGRFVAEFFGRSNELFKQVTMTELYAVQVWPRALDQLISARDDVIALAFSWEYWVRTEMMNKEDPEIVKASWKQDADSTATVPVADYFSRAMTSPGNIKTRFDASLNTIKSDTRIGDFKSAYSRAVQAGVEKSLLPGARPASAPTRTD